MASKKASEDFSIKKAGDLELGDKFRVPSDTRWQEIIGIDKKESDFLDTEFNTKKEIISCKTKIEGSIEDYFFTSFCNIEVEVLGGTR